MKFFILPSLLAADFGELAIEVERVEAAGADAVHLDIMDAHFVPNLSFGPDVVSLARRVAPSLFRSVHLMLTRPDLYVERFVEAGADSVQIHVEADCDIWETLATIRACGARSGLVLRPQTEVSMIKPYLRLCDEVLFMTVNPGYGGQAFIAEVLPRIAELRKCVAGTEMRTLDIMVDGGINYETAADCAAHGANMFVAGSFMFKQNEMGVAVTKMRNLCAAAEPKLSE
ncbi:MAG: ribulose-phosphate 3-epimerase [Kiritimatiellia bacterium]